MSPPSDIPHPPDSSKGKPALPGEGLSDEQLLMAYRRGQTQAFTQLILRYKQELFHFLIRFVGDRQAAEDMFQEAFLQVHLSVHSFDSKRRFKPWLFTIGANKARDYLRKSGRRSAMPLSASMDASDDQGQRYIDLMQADLQLPLDNLEREENRRQVQEILGTLPDHLREVLLLAYFHRFAYREIAVMLGVPLGTIKSRLHAAVATFAGEWKRRHGGAEF